MGSSSKKHKSEKRKKRSRSPERERERHRHHKRHKSHKRRYEEEAEIISSSDSDVEEVAVFLPPPPPMISSPPAPIPSIVIEDSPPRNATSTLDGKSHESLSIEETNALRAKLGLKPLQVESKKPVPVSTNGSEADPSLGMDMGEFVHKPATNIAQKAKTEKIRERLAERKEKRAIEAKLKKVKGLGESDSEDDTKDWVKKSREKEKQRLEAEKRLKQLDELDAEFGIGALVEEEKRSTRQEMYSSRDLRGLKVGHSTSGFEEGRNIILTLKDQEVLAEGDDTLINVNMVDNERYKKNLERKLKKPKYDEEDEEDPFNLKKHDVLSKYDEEIDGVKEESFSIGEEMSDKERIRQRLMVKKKLKLGSVVDLSSNLRLANDYYTEEEVAAKFKKPAKRKKLRKKPKALKADDLMPKEEVMWPSEDLARRSRKRSDSAAADDMDVDQPELDLALDVNDVPLPADDLYNVKIEPDEAELDLQLALNKARRLKQKEMHENTIENIANAIVKAEPSSNADGPGGSIVLNSTAEFCRTLGDIPTYGLSGNREEEEELLDFEREMKEESKRQEEERRNRGAWSQVELDEKPPEVVATEAPILDEEPDVGKGMAGALRLAISKGYLEKETVARPSASRFAHLQAQNYSIDDKAHADDDKFGRRDRYMGPASDFKEKDNYKPNVKLDYIDDDGRLLSAKEAFRYLSHKFHGKGPGKNKVEKRMKKNEQEGLMKQMSSTDTPLRTLTMLQQKQKETQAPYVVLSGNKQASATISKSK